MNFLDSTILSYAFYKNKFQDNCQKLISEGGVTNTLNLIESFNIIENETSRENAFKVIKGLLKTNLKIVDIDINLVFEALKKSDKVKLRFIDLVHYVCALQNNCHIISSYDSDFDNLDIPRIV